MLNKKENDKITRTDFCPKNMTTITLELPQNIYDSVQAAAAKAGQSPQELILQFS
jgi:hypothetical protein